MRPSLIISGGQTGADLAGLRAACALDISTGGFCPKYFIQEGGPAPFLGTVYGLEETDTTDFRIRTDKNIRMADATVIFGHRSPGSNRTEWHCQKWGKPFIWLPLPLKHRAEMLFKAFMDENQPKTLNIAGNRESVNPGIGDAVYDFLVGVLA